MQMILVGLKRSLKSFTVVMVNLVKKTARGKEQRTYEDLGGLEGTTNKQNPVGKNNPNRSTYLDGADKHPSKRPTKKEVNANYG